MTKAGDHIEQTVALLRAAPIERFLKAVAELEQQPDIAEIQEIKERIRERLAELRPPRKVNITRVFCEPFEELLRNQIEPNSTWVPRDAIAPCWRIVEGAVQPRLLMGLKQKLETVSPDDRRTLTTLGGPLWKAAAKVLETTVLGARAGDAAALDLLGNDPKMIAYAEVIAAACQIAPALEELKDIFPERPFKSMQLPEREALHDALARVAGERQYDLRCVIHIVVHWTANPAEVFDLCADLDLGASTPIGKALMAQREKVVVSLVGEQVKKLQADLNADHLDLADCAELARVAADSIGSALELLKDSKGSASDKDITELKQQLGAVVRDKVIGAATLALSSVWGSGKTGQELGKDTIIAAEAAARAMRKCGQAASKLGIELAITKKITTSLATVRDEVTGKIADLKNGAEPENLGAAQSTLANATRILEILEGPERAFEFFREKRAAIRAHA